MELAPTQCQALLEIARGVIRAALTGQRITPRNEQDPALLQPAGCFVSLHSREGRRLRGCVGRLDATAPLASAVAAAAASVLRDPRFRTDPVTLAELPLLDLELSVLSPLRPAAGILEFNPQTDGIHLACGGRSGLFLPQVARETGWGREQLLTRLCTEKLGLAADAWKDPAAKLSIFTTLIIGPEPFEPQKSGD